MILIVFGVALDYFLCLNMSLNISSNNHMFHSYKVLNYFMPKPHQVYYICVMFLCVSALCVTEE